MWVSKTIFDFELSGKQVTALEYLSCGNFSATGREQCYRSRCLTLTNAGRVGCMELFKNTNFDFLGKKWPFIILSLVLTAAGIDSLIMKGGPRYGIDFRGGALVTVRFAQRPPVEKVRGRFPASCPVEVQEVTENNQDDIIGTDVQDDKASTRPGRRLSTA